MLAFEGHTDEFINDAVRVGKPDPFAIEALAGGILHAELVEALFPVVETVLRHRQADGRDLPGSDPAQGTMRDDERREQAAFDPQPSAVIEVVERIVSIQQNRAFDEP